MVPRLCALLVIVGCWATWAGGVAAQSTSPYCSFTPEHTLCKSSGLGARCGQQVQGRGVGAEDAAAIVALHNQLRSRVASGQEARGAPGPQPSAANMRLMVWDNELATVAQGHANQCIFEHECTDCRRVARFGVGQNLFISFQSNFDGGRIQWARAIRAWYDEVVDFSPSDIQPFQFSTAVGHYTQMLWWSSERVGCGYTMYREDGWWKKLYTCNYGPSGNIIFSQMYRRGPPCSACPDGTTCSLNYPGLCGPVGGSAFEPSLTTNQVLEPNSVPSGSAVAKIPPPSATLGSGVRSVQALNNGVTNGARQNNGVTNGQGLGNGLAAILTQGSRVRSGPTLGSPVNPFANRQPDVEEIELRGEEEIFVPMKGEVPQMSDLMPFLNRAGLNTQVIRTSSLASVHGIINALPRGTMPIVLFRSGSGKLTELNAQTLLPLQRFSRSTTTRGPKTNALTSALLVCDIDISPCEVTPVGGNWAVGNSESEGRYAEVLLSEGEGAQVVVRQLVQAPRRSAGGEVCVALSHRRTFLPSLQALSNNATLPPLQVGVMPLGGQITRRSVLGAPGVWEMTRLTFTNLKTSFLVVVTVGPATVPSTVALDSIMVTEGACCLSGRC